MATEIRQDCKALRLAGLGVTPAQQGFRSGLMQVLAETDDPPFRLRGAPPTADGPSRQNFGEVCDVGLRIAAIDTERVQLQDLTRQVLVDADLALRIATPLGQARNLRIRSCGAFVVEIGDDCGMLLDGT